MKMVGVEGRVREYAQIAGKTSVRSILKKGESDKRKKKEIAGTTELQSITLCE